MITRAVALAAGIFGAAGGAQLPEFSQQYIQRLGGAVDELRGFVADFDADAAAVGLGREAALVDLARGGALAQERAKTMEAMITRFERMSAALEAVEGAGPFSQAYAVMKSPDPEVAKATWQVFQPAAPLSLEGGVFGGVGFLTGVIGGALIMGLLRGLFGRRKPAGGAA